MCTVTWWRRGDDAFGVFFNRDESRQRARSIPVAASVSATGTRFLAPRDPVGGGTWLMVNERGLIAGVLNHYEAAGELPPGKVSRGTLPITVAACGVTAEALETVKRLPLADFAPFIFVAWDREDVAACVWDGADLRDIPRPHPPLPTSSYRTAEVLAWRTKRLEALSPGGRAAADLSPGVLALYHADTEHPEGAFNVRMRRPDARTESICHVSVDTHAVRFLHQRERDENLGVLDSTEAALRII